MEPLTPDLEFGPVRVYLGEKSGKYPDGNQVIVQGADRRAVFDSPLNANRIGADFDGADIVIQGHMHEDHTAGLHRLPHVPVYIHQGDLAAMRSWEGLCTAYGYDPDMADELRAYIEGQFHYTPRPDALPYTDGSTWDLGGGVTVRAVHTPGHTTGHCVLLVEPEGVAFIGDIDLTGFGPYYGDHSSDLADFRRTLATLPDIPARTWVTFHHRGVYTEREHFLADLAAFTGKLQEREERLLQMMEAGPLALEQMVEQGILYKPDTEVIWAKFAEERSILQHLDELVARKVVERDPQGLFRLG